MIKINGESIENINGRTVSKVEELSDPAPELARMLGGGDSALTHAKELCRKRKK